MSLKKIIVDEAKMVRRMGFNPSSEFNVKLSLKTAFEEYHPTEGKGALDSYAEKIISSEPTDENRITSLNLLNSIKEKADDFKILLDDFNFEDNSQLATTIFTKIDGDIDPGVEDTLRFYDFNIHASIESGMEENVVGLLDQLDEFFDELIGMLADPSLSTQKPPQTPIGFKENKKPLKRKLTETIKKLIKEQQLYPIQYELCPCANITAYTTSGCTQSSWYFGAVTDAST